MAGIEDLIKTLNLKVFAPGKGDSFEAGYTGDLLSLVIGSAPSNSIWITVQRHINIVGVASLKDIPAIIISQGLVPDEDVRQKAEEEGIWLLGSSDDSFTLSGKIFKLLQGESLSG
ncbi:MAG: hypothetical protein NUV68_01755 [Caldiserica bacterium]|jgi:hypothetical protein|nr:hypothetical protein [Caldisericota bacterium]MDH7562082.1 hypothetical protein [Caldisericota bacterium]